MKARLLTDEHFRGLKTIGGQFPMKKMRILVALFLAAALLNPCLASGESFLVISDTHLTKEVRDHEDMLKAVIEAAQGKDAVLLLGDSTNNARPEEHNLVLQWTREIRQRSGAEVYMIPGNHDYRPLFGPDDFTAWYRSCGWGQAFSRDLATAGYALMTENGTCLIMLDTNDVSQARSALPYGGIGESTLRWVREVLDALPDGTPVLVCGHHAVLPAERDERTPGANALSMILRAYGVGLYLCGHDHVFATAEQEGLRQITVGQPQAYPGWVGIVEQDQGAFRWNTQPIYDEQSPVFIRLREDAYSLGRRMAEGTLETTPYADDEDAVEWFASAYMLFAGGDMTPERSASLLADDNCRKWRRVETRTVVKDWILGLLENNPENVRCLDVPVSQKHDMKAPDSF